MSNAHENTSKKQMLSDVEMARGYVLDIGGKTSVQVMLARAYKILAEMFPHEGDPKSQWTERRVKSFWWRDAAIVEFREMRELHAAAAKAKEERELLQKARKEHAAFIEKTASLRALLERTDEDFFSSQIEGLRGQSRDLDRTRT